MTYTIEKQGSKYWVYFNNDTKRKHCVYKVKTSEPYMKWLGYTFKFPKEAIENLHKMVNENLTTVSGEYSA